MAEENLKYFWKDFWNQSPYTVKNFIYDQHLGLLNSTELKYVEQFLEKSYNICEAGCGMGQWVAYLYSKGYRCYGFDYVFSGLKKCRYEYGIDTLCQADLLNMPYKPNVFDMILSWGAVEHFPKEEDIGKALREMHRTLKSSGTLIITVPYKHFLIRLKSLIRLFLLNIPIIRRKLHQQPPFFEYTFTKKRFRKNTQAKQLVCAENNVTGRLVEPKNAQKLAKAIIDLLKNPQERQRISENINKKFNNGNFSWNYIAEKTLEVYKKAIGKK
ncbi:MAG: methyltransferase domain-containing protein [Candidatus Omnitrophota bacterium]|nr:methyltransferase domain-containing protein [Candidatus Omnitrophota bacterium]